jgi:hypothetical protein
LAYTCMLLELSLRTIRAAARVPAGTRPSLRPLGLTRVERPSKARAKCVARTRSRVCKQAVTRLKIYGLGERCELVSRDNRSLLSRIIILAS